MAGKSDIKAGRAYVELYLKDSALMRGLKSIRQQAQTISDEFMRMGRQLTTIGAAMAIPIGLATKRFADFDDQMRTVKAVAEASEADFQNLSETAKRLGLTSGFTAVQVSQMMTELGRAGFNAQQIEVMTAAVINLARASGTDGAAAAGIMSATIRQFGLDATQAARVADVLTQAANATFSSVEGLGESLSYAGPVAAALGMSLEDTVAIVGALGNVGIQGSEAGTALRRLSVIAAGSGEELQAIFGISNTDAGGNLKPLIDILDEINDATADMPVAERTAKMSDAFGLLGITSATVLSKTAGGVRALADDLRGAGGVAAETAKEMDGGLGGAIRKMTGAVEGVAIAIGEALAPVLVEIGEYLIPALRAISQFIKQNQAVIKVAAGVAAGILALGGTLLGIGAIFGTISFIVGGIGTAITAVTATIGAIGAVIASPFLLLAGIIVGLGAVIVGIAAYWLFFTDEGRRALKAVRQYFQPLIDFFSTVFGGIRDALMSGEIGLAGKIAVQALMHIFNTGIAYIVRQIFKIPEALWEMYDRLPEMFKIDAVTRVLQAGNSKMGLIQAKLDAATFAGAGELGKLIAEAAAARKKLEAPGSPKAPESAYDPYGGAKLPGAPGPNPEDLAKLKTIGSFDAVALTMQNWGVIPAPKVDKQAEMLKKLDEIYRANVGIVPAVKEVRDAVKEGNVAFEPIP